MVKLLEVDVRERDTDDRDWDKDLRMKGTMVARMEGKHTA
jgi:hypothetical protein